MAKTILAEAKGFTPLIDILVEQYGGVITAAVFGRVWRYCQGESRECFASLETIASELGLSYATALRHIKLLCEDGYLNDETPGLRNRPHTYTDTGKVGVQVLLKAGLSESKSGLSESKSGLSESKSTLSESKSHSIRKIDEDTNKKQDKKQQQERNKKSVVVNSQSSLSPKQQASYTTLTAAGIEDNTAQRIAEKVDPVRIAQVCLAAELKEGIEDKPAWIVAAFNNGWSVRTSRNDTKPRTEEDRLIAAGQYRIRNSRTGEWEEPP